MLRRQPMIVLRRGTKRDVGHKAQLANIAAGKAVADIVRTTMGPNSMLKMLLNPMGTVVITNDGNAILREIDVAHPAAKSIIELSRAQKEEVGDGTTSVVVLTGEVLASAETLLKNNIHPTNIVGGLMQALEDSVHILSDLALQINDDNDLMQKIVWSSLQSKTTDCWSNMIPKLAVDAARMVKIDRAYGEPEIDVKRYVHFMKIPGGEIEESCVLSGIMLNKDVTHSRMKRYIENPKIVLLDCSLEYKKAESATNVEIVREEDWEKLLRQEETEVKKMCDAIIATGCNVCITEKGVSDLAQHFLLKAGISVIRRIRKTDNNRLARVTGATICTRTEELTSNDVGTKAGLFEIKTIGNEYYTFITKGENAHACTILLRGPSKEVLADIERTLSSALVMAKNIIKKPSYLPGGGACEMALATKLAAKINQVSPQQKEGYRCLINALRVVPRTIIATSGQSVLTNMTELEAKHLQPGNEQTGFSAVCGKICNVIEKGIFDSTLVKIQVLRTAIEAACIILRIDDILSGISRNNKGGQSGYEDGQEQNTFGDSRDG